MTIAQKNIIRKMETVHRVKIWGEGAKGALIVFSYNENKCYYLSYRIGYKGTANLLSVIRCSIEVDNLFRKMLTLREWGAY